MQLDFGFVAVPLEVDDNLKAVLKKHCGDDHNYRQIWTELLNAAQNKVVYHNHPPPRPLLSPEQRAELMRGKYK